MSWAVTGVSAGLAIAGGISANQQASANAKATAMQLLQSFNVQQNNLQNQAIDLNNQIGMELSKANFEKMSALGTIHSVGAEKGIAGRTATRLSNNIEMQQALTTDAIIQSGEAKMTEVQTNMTNSFMSYQQGLFQNEMTRINNTKSAFEIAVAAGQAGLSGYSMAQSAELVKLGLETAQLNKTAAQQALTNASALTIK